MTKILLSGASRFNDKDKEYLKGLGMTNFYELRDGEGTTYTIENEVLINNIGCMATNFEIEELTNGGSINDTDFFNKYKPYNIEREVDYSKIS